MPEPSAPPPAALPRKELPKDLDKAFQRAMLHGDMRQLREVLGGAQASPAVIHEPSPRRVQPATPTAGAPVLAVDDLAPEALEALDEPLGSGPIPGPAPVPARDLYARLSRALVEAGGWQDDPRAAAEVLRGARDTLELLIERLDELEGPSPLVLPPYRQPWALFVAPPGDADRLHAVAEALGVDLATARQIAVLGHPRAALRSADPAELEDRAARYRSALALPARVLDEATLRAQPAARLALSLAAEGPWRSAPSASWEPDGQAVSSLDARDDPPPPLRLVVVGEVISTRFRELRGRGKGDGRLAAHGERRLRVLDLHHDSGVLRVVEGITQLSGWPGLEPRSSALAFRGLSDVLAARHPGVPITGRCICRPTRQPEAQEDGRIEAAGWPAWEEHSRACRALFL